MKQYICNYCKKVFSGKTGKVPCPNCGHQKPCSGHRILSRGERDLLKRDYPQVFNKESK